MKDFLNSIINGSKFFVEDRSRIYFVLQQVFRYFKMFKNNLKMAWISKGLSDQSIKSTVTSGNGFDPRLDDSLNNFKLLLEFNGSNKITNLYITFEIK